MACREVVKELKRSVASKAKQNPKAFYAYIRANTRGGIANLWDGSDRVYLDSEKDNVFNKFFTSVYTEDYYRQVMILVRLKFLINWKN
jgi:sarcosine oxidase delta subunit